MISNSNRRIKSIPIEGEHDGKNDLRVIFGPDGKILYDGRKKPK